MKPSSKNILISLILLCACGREVKKKEHTEQDNPEYILIKKERKDVNLPDLAYSYTFDKDKETVLEEINAFSHELDRFNQENGSMKLDGVSDYVSIENHEHINPKTMITVSIWYKPDSFKGNGNNSILNKGFSSYETPFSQYALTVVGDKYPKVPGTFRFILSINGIFRSVRTQPNTWIPGEWYLLTGTYDGRKMAFYVNDALMATRSVTGKLDNYNSPLLIGKTPYKEFYTSCSIDDLKIFKRALTKDEIAELYNNR